MSEKEIVQARANAGRSAVKFFDIIEIKSANDPFAYLLQSQRREQAWRTLQQYRFAHNDTHVAQGIEDAARTGVGNCHEKGMVCYSSLKSNPRLRDVNNVTLHHVSLVTCNGYDHVFCTVTDAPVTAGSTIGQLGRRALIVDGWTQDWYFPNLDVISRTMYSATSVANPRQLLIRAKVLFYSIRPLPTVDVAPRKVRKYA